MDVSVPSRRRRNLNVMTANSGMLIAKLAPANCCLYPKHHRDRRKLSASVPLSRVAHCPFRGAATTTDIAAATARTHSHQYGRARHSAPSLAEAPLSLLSFSQASPSHPRASFVLQSNTLHLHKLVGVSMSTSAPSSMTPSRCGDGASDNTGEYSGTTPPPATLPVTR